MKQNITRTATDWGYDFLWAKTPFYEAHQMVMQAGKQTPLQHHVHKMKTVYLKEGTAIFFQDGTGAIMEPGDVYHIPAKSAYQITAFTDCVLFEVSLPFPNDAVIYNKGNKEQNDTVK